MSSAPPQIIVQFPKDDAELLSAITETFGKQAEPISVRPFDGGIIDIIQLALPVISATAPFLLKYFSTKEATRKSKRVVLGPKGEITIVGYDADAINGLLEKIKSRSK
jgi:hypothetical protein